MADIKGLHSLQSGRLGCSSVSVSSSKNEGKGRLRAFHSPLPPAWAKLVCQYVYKPVCIFVCQYVYQYYCNSDCLSVGMSVCQFVCICDKPRALQNVLNPPVIYQLSCRVRSGLRYTYLASTLNS